MSVLSGAINEVLTVCVDNEQFPMDLAANSSFCSIATSVGPTGSPTSQTVWKTENIFVETSDDDELVINEEEEQELVKKACSDILAGGPIKELLEHDRQNIAAVHQNELNEFILKHTKNSTVNRQDHNIMLRQLIGEAFFRDRERAAHRTQWKRILVAIRKEYWGANAIFTLSPDPYHNVLAVLSSMTMWNDDVRSLQYRYCEKEFNKRRERQAELLEGLQRTGKLFV